MPNSALKFHSGVVFRTRLGWFGLSGPDLGVRLLTFGHKSQDQVQTALAVHAVPLPPGPAVSRPLAPDAPFQAADWAESAQSLLKRYADGEPVDLNSIPLDLPQLTRFQRRVVQQLRNVGYGETISYGELAKDAGSPGAARAVGNMMAQNPIPLIIPCHRVVGSGGKLGGYSAPQGLAMKRRLLEMEQHAKAFACADTNVI